MDPRPPSSRRPLQGPGHAALLLGAGVGLGGAVAMAAAGAASGLALGALGLGAGVLGAVTDRRPGALRGVVDGVAAGAAALGLLLWVRAASTPVDVSLPPLLGGSGLAGGEAAWRAVWPWLRGAEVWGAWTVQAGMALGAVALVAPAAARVRGPRVEAPDPARTASGRLDAHTTDALRTWGGLGLASASVLAMLGHGGPAGTAPVGVPTPGDDTVALLVLAPAFAAVALGLTHAWTWPAAPRLRRVYGAALGLFVAVAGIAVVRTGAAGPAWGLAAALAVAAVGLRRTRVSPDRPGPDASLVRALATGVAVATMGAWWAWMARGPGRIGAWGASGGPGGPGVVGAWAALVGVVAGAWHLALRAWARRG